MSRVKWEKVHYIKLSPLSMYVAAKGFKRCLEKILGKKFSVKTYKHIDGDIYYGNKTRKELRKRISTDLWHTVPWLLKKIEENNNKFLTVSKEAKGKDYTKLSDKRLIRYFEKYLHYYKRMLSLVEVLREIEWVLDQQLYYFINRKIKDNIEKEKHHASLAITQRGTEMTKERKDLLRLVTGIYKSKKIKSRFVTGNIKEMKKYLNKNKPLLEKFIYHQKKYCWMGMRFLLGQPYDLNHYLKKVKKMLKKDLYQIIKEEQILKRETKKYFTKSFNVFVKLKNFRKCIRLINNLIFIRNRRIEIFTQANYNFRPLLSEIAKRLKLKYQDLIFLKGDEIIDHLQNKRKIDRTLINERKECFGVILKDDQESYFQGESCLKMKEKIRLEIQKITFIKGQVANLGIAKGTVKIVKFVKEIHKVKRGDILVSVTTTPDFVPAMEISSAIVTDTGGITCHAAIVSRELGIPCVIDTKIATKVLKDGDRVEVDANKGIVKILKKD